MTADEARGRIGEIRSGLRRAMRELCRPDVDWDSAAGHLYRAERDCRRLAAGCIRQEVEEETSDC